MPINCSITIDGIDVYGTVVKHTAGIRFRVWSREWETLGVEAGRVVAVKLPHDAETRLLIASVYQIPDTGKPWVHFVAPVKISSADRDGLAYTDPDETRVALLR